MGLDFQRSEDRSQKTEAIRKLYFTLQIENKLKNVDSLTMRHL